MMVTNLYVVSPLRKAVIEKWLHLATVTGDRYILCGDTCCEEASTMKNDP